MKTKTLLARYGSISLLLALAACGGSDENASDNSAPGATYSPTTAPLGNFNVKCDQSPGQQVQQQSPYQQQQQQSGGSCTPQFEFYSAVVTNFDVDLDCRNNRVLVTGKGVDQSSAAIPIQGDGSWKGQVTVNQSVANDGQGNVYCKVKTIVNFDGNASCSQGSEGLNWGTTVNFAQSSGAGSAALASLNSTSRFSNDMPGIAASTPLASDPLTEDPLAQPSVLPTPVASATNGPDAGAGVEAGIASPTPSASPSVCSFSNPQSVNSQALTIDIPAGAGDLGCTAYGAGAYQVFSGTQVTWINHDTQPHTVTADSDSGDSFDSGSIQPGQSFTHVFSAVGSFRYHSTLDSNMQGLIVVQVAPASPTPSPSQTASPIVIPPVTPTPSVAPSPSVSPSASPSASPSPSPSVSPRPSPSPSPSVSPSASPSPSPSVSPGTSPSPSVTQIVSCVVVNPCPIFAQTTQKCPLPAQQ